MSTMISRFSLRKKLLVMMLGCSAAISIAALLVFEHTRNAAEAGKLHSYETYATDLSERISAQFYERYGDVQAFAVNTVLQSNDPKQIGEVLNRYTSLYGIYDLILFVDTKGQLIASNTKATDGTDLNLEKLKALNFSNAPWFQAVVNERFTEDLTKGFKGTFVEDPQIDKLTSLVYGKEIYGNSFSSKVTTPSGELLGVLTTRANFVWVENEFILLYKQLSAAGLGSTDLTLLDKRGFILVDFDPLLSGDSTSITHDFKNVLLKLNLIDRGVAAAKAIGNGESGVMYADHARKKITQAAGFATIRSSKFIDSIGWGVLVRTSKEELLAELTRARWAFIFSTIVLFFLAGIISLLFANALAKNLTGMAERLTSESREVSATSEEVAGASTELSSAATEQAAALQETVSSLDEVNAMVRKNADNARRSQEVSTAGHAAAIRGKQAVDSMRESIEEISHSNANVMKQIEASNTEIAGIVKIIAEIGNKTKVINDIVFQTKLLSFNASVEAARAGEHGKGFAVVAEEVGNLAQMSGNAAKEISQMLEDSIRQVEKTVQDTKVKVDSLIGSGKEKIESGLVTSRRCGEALDEIVQNVGELGQLVNEIATASQEQAQGVQEISKAMGQLDQVTQQNAASSQQAASAASQLNGQAEALRGIVEDLVHTVDGNSEKVHSGVSFQGSRSSKTNEVTDKSGKLKKATKATTSVAGRILPFRKKEGSVSANNGKQQTIGDLPGSLAAGSEVFPLESDARFEDI